IGLLRSRYLRRSLVVVEVSRIDEINVRGNSVAICRERRGLVSGTQCRFSLDELQLRVGHERHLRLVGEEIPAWQTKARRAWISVEVVGLLRGRERTKRHDVRVQTLE